MVICNQKTSIVKIFGAGLFTTKKTKNDKNSNGVLAVRVPVVVTPVASALELC